MLISRPLQLLYRVSVLVPVSRFKNIASPKTPKKHEFWGKNTFSHFKYLFSMSSVKSYTFLTVSSGIYDIHNKLLLW